MKSKGATLQQAERLNVDIQSLEIVRDNLEKEIHDLHYAKANLQNQLSQAQKEVREIGARKQLEMNRTIEANRMLNEQRETKLYNLEKNLEVIQRQLNDREAAVSARELKVADLEHRKDVLRLESLEVEKLKNQAKQELVQAEAKMAEVESQLSVVRSIQEDAHSKLREAKKYRDEVLNTEFRNQETSKQLALQARVVEQASEALAQKMNLPLVSPTREPAQVSQEPPKRGPGRPRKEDSKDAE